MVEDDPNAKGAANKTKSYAGSRTSQFDYSEQTFPGAYSSSSSAAHKPQTNTYEYHKPSSLIGDSSRYDSGNTYSKYSSPTSLQAEQKRQKSARYKKYAGAKTSYGDMGGVSYNNSASKPSNDSNRYTDYGSKYNQYRSSPSDYKPSRYTNNTAYSGAGSSRYAGSGSSFYTPIKPSGTGTHSSSSFTPPTSYYQPVSSQQYGASSRFQPHYADVKPSAESSRGDTYETKNNLSLRKKEDTPEHNVSDAIEQKASKYGGKYETSDGKIYYGGKPKKYSSKKSKKYQTRRKTAHADDYHNETSDRPPSV